MEREKSWEQITEIGNKIREVWANLANLHGIDISLSGIPSLSTYSFNYDEGLKYKTLLTQEMLERGFLASTNFYASLAHEDHFIDQYSGSLNYVYSMIKDCIDQKSNIDDLLKGPVCHSGFKRLN
jgi:hypothetical protein